MAKTAKQTLSEQCISYFKREFRRWHPDREIYWRSTRGSGNQTHDKGDLELEINGGRYLVEHKATEAKQFTLKFAALCKARGEAWAKGCAPVFALTFRNPETHIVDHFVVLRLGDWEFKKND